MVWKQKPLERGVGVAVLAALLILVTALLVSTQGRKIFQSYKDTKFYMENGQGIRQGTTVTVNGLPAGTVEKVDLVQRQVEVVIEGEIHFEKVDHVEVTVRVHSPFDEYLREGSKVKVNLPFIMGNTTIDIIPGPVDAAPLAQGDELEKEVVKGLGGKVETFIDTGNTVLVRFEKVSSDLEDAVADIAGITNKINYGKNTLGELLNDDRKMYNQIVTLLADADAAAGNLNRLASDLKEITADLPVLLKDLRSGAANLRTTSEKSIEVANDVGALPAELKRTLDDLDRSVAKLKVFTEDLAPFGKELNRFAVDDFPVLAKLIADTADAASLLEVASRDMPGVMQKTKDTLDKTEAITLSLKGTWPIRGNLPPADVRPRTIRLAGRHKAVAQEDK